MGAVVPCTTLFLIVLSFSCCLCSDEYHIEKKRQDCGKNYTIPIGSFTLTLHNLSHPCFWFINAAQLNSTGINLLFETLFLHENDEVTLYRNEEDFKANRSLIEPLRAQNGSVTIATNETQLFIKLEGNATGFDRIFSGYFHAQACVFAIPLSIHIMHSPVVVNKTGIECKFNFIKDMHKLYYMPAIVMEEFNYSKSSLEVTGASFFGQYTHDPPIDFFPSWKSGANEMTLKTTVEEKSNEYYRFHIAYVDSRCSGLVDISQEFPTPLHSPKYELNNGSYITECRYVIKHSDPKQIFGIVFDNLYFNSVNDILAINNGASELSSPLLQVTTSNKGQIMKQMIRSSGGYMWLSFNPVNYSSFFSANVTVHRQGGYFKNNGSFTMNTSDKEDSIFLLEVENSKLVLVNFTSSKVNSPGKVDIFDGFDKSNLLASLQGNIWYPVLGKSSYLMVIATGFNTGSSFTAEFKGVLPGCYQMSTLTSENYILNENCNTTCEWVIPPQNLPNSMLALDLQYLSLKNNTKVEIMKLDLAKTLLGSISSNVTHVPQLVIEANVGALVKVIQGKCEKKSEDVILIGHSSYVPICGGRISPKVSESFFITSPRYPDTYPLLANCQWNISVAKDNFVHLAFDSLQLAPNHCINISNGQKTFPFSGSHAPDDMLLNGETVIEFNSQECGKSVREQKLVSDAGFMLNSTVADCGGILENQKTGVFNTSTVGNKSLCIWMISVPYTTENDKTVNSISFTIVKKDDLKNYNLQIYDGASVREPMVNMSSTDIWARTNNIIVIYKRLDVSKPSSVFVINYKTIACNSSMQCDNGICLHPEWRCNGINECGDFTDEKNCASVPVPPKIDTSVYSPAAFWSCVIILFVVGILGGAVGLHFWRKYKSGYNRFSSSIE